MSIQKRILVVDLLQKAFPGTTVRHLTNKTNLDTAGVLVPGNQWLLFGVDEQVSWADVNTLRDDSEFYGLRLTDWMVKNLRVAMHALVGDREAAIAEDRRNTDAGAGQESDGRTFTQTQELQKESALRGLQKKLEVLCERQRDRATDAELRQDPLEGPTQSTLLMLLELRADVANVCLEEMRKRQAHDAILREFLFSHLRNARIEDGKTVFPSESLVLWVRKAREVLQ